MSRDEPSTCKLSAVDQAQAVHGTAGQLISRKAGALTLVAAAYLLGGGGMLAWLAFLLWGPLIALGLDLGIFGRLLVDASLCLLFFAQHSLMVRRRFRVWLTRFVRADFHGALYAAVSGAGLLLLTGLWQPVGADLWKPQGWLRWALLTLFFSAGVGAWWGSRSLGAFDALGVRPALRAAGDSKPMGSPPFTVRGPYRWVRHPLYLFSLIIIWSGPVFSVDRLLHNGLWTVWIVVGAIMEERDLVDCFGDAYRSYQQTVPMLLPTSVKPLMAASEQQPPNGS